jgi:lipopolysaccharide biosynthesis protein
MFLLENLLGCESRSMADTILTHMNNDASIGMVFPDDPYVVSWGANFVFAENIADRLGLKNLPVHFIYPVGAMFLARASTLAPLINLNLDWSDYPEAPVLFNQTLLSTFERLLSLTPSLVNLHNATTNIIGLTR